MGTQNENSLLLSMAIPMMISMLAQALYNVVDTMFVSKLGQDALTALSLAFPVQNLMIALGVGTGVGMNALLSKSLGEKDFNKANKSADNGIFLAFVSTLFIMLIGALFSKPYFRSFGSSENVIDFGTQYLSICLIFSAGLFAQVTFERLLQSTGKTTYSMITQLTGALLNIILDPIMIYGYLGFPKMGVAGAAIATVIGQVVAGCLALFFNLKFNKEIKITFSGICHPDGKIIAKIYSVGVPSIIMASIGSVMTVCLNQIVRVFDEATAATAQAVFGIYFKLQSFIFMPVFGLNNGMVPIVAYNYGARHKKRITKTITLSIIYACGIMVIGFLLFQFCPEALLRIFDTKNPEEMERIIAIGVPTLRSISYSFLFAGYCIIAGSVFQALGNGMLSLWVSVCRQLIVLVPAAYILAVTTHNVNMVWYSFPIAEIASLTLSIIFMRHVFKKEISPLAEQ